MVRCIAPVVLDGGTRFRLRGEPGFPQAAPPFRHVLDELVRPTSRDEDAAERRRGGRVIVLPQRQDSSADVTARVTIAGTRRQSIKLYVEDVVHVSLSVETGEAELQLKARALWAQGYAALAASWLDLVCWWLTGRACRLDQAQECGWRTTGIEVCADFVGVRFRSEDSENFVGFKANEVVRKFSRDGCLETLNFGTRSRSPISLCIYDKDAQIAAAKQGDDSIYRAAHLENGWDGQKERRRVEFRVVGPALSLVDDETGEVLDFRDPAKLADREALCRLWAVLCSKKRLVVRETATRAWRCKTDSRWDAVLAASGEPFQDRFRQLREPQQDAHEEACRRAQRDAMRSTMRWAALHDHSEADPRRAWDLLYRSSTDEQRVELKEYARRYRQLREAFMGDEIRTLGRARWIAAACTDSACTDSACTDSACTDSACTDSACTDSACTDSANEADAARSLVNRCSERVLAWAMEKEEPP